MNRRVRTAPKNGVTETDTFAPILERLEHRCLFSCSQPIDNGEHGLTETEISVTVDDGLLPPLYLSVIAGPSEPPVFSPSTVVAGLGQEEIPDGDVFGLDDGTYLFVWS